MNIKKFVFDFVNSIAIDKLRHFFLGTLISFVLVVVFGILYLIFFNQLLFGLITGYLLSLCIFIWKEEVIDNLHKQGNPELADFLMGALGATIVLCSILITRYCEILF